MIINQVDLPTRGCSISSALVQGELRPWVADKIRSEPEVYNEVYLGKAPEDYIVWIQQPENVRGFVLGNDENEGKGDFDVLRLS
jgi:hypothetical protein